MTPAACLLALAFSQDPCLATDRMPSPSLTPEETAALEAKVTAAPEDAAARAQLVAAYARLAVDPALRERGIPHLEWLIAHCPRAAVLGTPMAGTMVAKDEETYHRLRDLWLGAVDRDPKDARVLLNTALFVGINELTFARQLLERATAADPGCERCWSQLGHVYELLANRTGGEEEKKLAGQALAAHERALGIGNDPRLRFYGLPVAAKAALRAGALDRARELGNELLALAAKYRDDWNYGNAIHHGHVVLGRVELREGRLDLARVHLLQAGDTPGSPQLKSFGPNLALADELLKAGEQKAVLGYLGRCEKFWKRGKPELKRWAKEIKQGQHPDFGANLLY